MKRVSQIASLILGLLGLAVLAVLGLLFKAVLGRYILVFLVGFFGLSFIVTFVAFILVILTVPPGTTQKD
jgi:hypothetical protein